MSHHQLCLIERMAGFCLAASGASCLPGLFFFFYFPCHIHQIEGTYVQLVSILESHRPCTRVNELGRAPRHARDFFIAGPQEGVCNWCGQLGGRRGRKGDYYHHVP